jgi:hypothetical protein
MGHRKSLTSLIVSLAAVFTPFSAFSANTYKVNPFGIAYQSTTGVSQYGNPGGILIPSDCNRESSAFASARANGAEILAYLNPVSVPDVAGCALRAEFYMGDVRDVPRWPYPSLGKRLHHPGYDLADLRKNSAWSNYVVNYVAMLMQEDKVDGVFLDVLGARIWSTSANWDSWPQWEKDAYTDGAVDLVRRLYAKRNATNPNFILITNGLWDRGDSRGFAGERYIDGVSREHPSYSSEYQRNYVKRTFGDGRHRRVIVIATSTADALNWKATQGVTHVSNQMTYSQVTAPPVGFNRLTDRPKRFGKSSSGETFTSGLAANTKRGSRFYLGQKGLLLNMGAYVDGNGSGTSGSQSLRMVLYRDSSGRPGTRVAQSNTMSVAVDSSRRWVYFPSPAAQLDPGYYWIMIHSGSTNAITRVMGSVVPNVRSNTDTFSDGAASPAGTVGSLGTTTLSVFAHYTVGY